MVSSHSSLVDVFRATANACNILTSYLMLLGVGDVGIARRRSGMTEVQLSVNLLYFFHLAGIFLQEHTNLRSVWMYYKVLKKYLINLKAQTRE